MARSSLPRRIEESFRELTAACAGVVLSMKAFGRAFYLRGERHLLACGHRLPGSNRTSRLRKKRRKAIEQLLYHSLIQRDEADA